MAFELQKDFVLSSEFQDASRTGILTSEPHPLWKRGDPPRGVKEIGGYNPHDVVYTTFSGTDITAVLIMPNEKKPLVLGELQTISVSIHRENTPVRMLGRVGPCSFVKGPRTIAGSLIFTNFNQYAFYRLQQYRIEISKGLYAVADMLPPFDIVLSFQNESGAFSKMRVYGVTIVDEGTTMSVDDLYTESTYTYMARGIQPLTPYVPDNWESVDTVAGTIVNRPKMEFR